jgi:hypothetical protein
VPAKGWRPALATGGAASGAGRALARFSARRAVYGP